MKYDLIIFDCDGTLTDTGATHVAWCNWINESQGFNLPKVNTEDKIAVRTVLGNPMETVIRKYGFPESDVDRLVKEYQSSFSSDFRFSSATFPGIYPLLAKIATKRVPTGIVTSNVMSNVIRDLGRAADEVVEIYDKDYLDRKGWKKADGIRCMKGYFGSLSPVYVGDTMKDFEAASLARVPFLGVSWGWELNGSQKGIVCCNTMAELEDKLLG
jgi:phosphoglycolate phosphatase